MWYLAVAVALGVFLMSNKTSIESDFNSCIGVVLDKEGGYSNDPNDPGGETKYGISKRAYPALDIKNLTLEQAYDIYKRDYWDKILSVFPHLNLMILDCSINQGVSFSKSVYAEVLQLTPLTAQGQIEYFAQKREERYRRNPNFARYGNGWLNRLSDIKQISENSLNA